jgi:hypothetical protein
MQAIKAKGWFNPKLTLCFFLRFYKGHRSHGLNFIMELFLMTL